MTSCEREHGFTLVLTGIAGLTNEAEDALYEAGCDDATLGFRFGAVHMTFSRVAPSLEDAIRGALREVRAAKIGADVIRVDISEDIIVPAVARVELARVHIDHGGMVWVDCRDGLGRLVAAEPFASEEEAMRHLGSLVGQV